MALQNNKINLCLVDDEINIVSSISEAISEFYDVKYFLSGLESLSAIQTGYKPDIIVTDLRMPKLDGFGFIKSLREINFDATIIMASGHADKSDVIKAMSLGVSAFLEKPFSIKQLTTAIDETRVVQNLQLIEKPERSDVELLNEHLEELCDLYFERATEAENQMLECSNQFYSNYRQVNMFLGSVRKSRILNRKIQDLKRKMNPKEPGRRQG